MPTPRRKTADPEAAFLKQLSDDPDDLTTLLVYADWLEDNAASDRAEFLRLQQQLLQMRYRQKGFCESSRRLLKLGKHFDAAWLGIVSRPRLVGTCWSGPSTLESHYVWRFLPRGVLNYTSPTGTFQNGTWQQIGTVVLMEVNRHYADHEGFIGGDWIHGRSANVVGQRWRWKTKRTTDLKECDLGKPVTAVYDGHLTARSRRGRRRR
jgi:uncharacterized protein (TIGR02996 family)